MNLKFYPCEACKEYRKDKKKYATKRTWWQILLGYCPWCGRYFRYSVKTSRRNTSYVDDASNWITGCKECREDDYEYFAELWNDYYSSIW